MLTVATLLLMKSLGIISMGILLAIGFNWGGLLVQYLNQKMGLVAA